ncbi:MAG: ATP-binding protein [Anaerolineaceae bacterium]
MIEETSGISVEYTLALLARLDLLIRREVIRFRLNSSVRQDDEYRGLYISDDEVNGLLNDQLPAHIILRPTKLPEDIDQNLAMVAAVVDSSIKELSAKASSDNVELRFNHLSKLFDLSENEQQILLICLAPELDLKYERLYAYLQDDVTKKRPTLDLVMRLLCPTFEARLDVRHAFEPNAPLLVWELVALNDDPGSRRPALPARYLKLDERIARYLLGSDQIDSRLLELIDPQVGKPMAAIPEDIQQRLSLWASGWERTWKNASPVILFHGRYGSGKHTAVLHLANAIGKPALMLSMAGLPHSGLRPDQAVHLAEREALLSGGLVSWDQVDDLLQSDRESELSRERDAFIRSLADSHTPTVLLANKAWEPGRDLRGRPFLRLEFPAASYAARKAAWSAELNGSNNFTDEELSGLAGRFQLNPGQIRDAVERAMTLMWSRDPALPGLQASDIDAASRVQSQHRLGLMARKLEPHYTWEDIVLPRQQLATLHLICTTVRQRPTVYGDWGFEGKLSTGKGMIALFSGVSGTGKTMASEIIANELGLDIFKINLSAVVSKYIGETEKNLERIFSEAQDTDAILFFDEADALFGKRSEVKDAHDRYANIETAYLLQRTEEYNGLVILASNIKKNMDEAFVRRIHFMVDFPFPEEPERLEIWRRTFPALAPRSEDIDLPFLARKLKITGGNIRNIILIAAFLAADEHEPISMRHLVRGASYEFQKIGKMIVEGDFEGYIEQARG